MLTVKSACRNFSGIRHPGKFKLRNVGVHTEPLILSLQMGVLITCTSASFSEVVGVAQLCNKVGGNAVLTAFTMSIRKYIMNSFVDKFS